MENSNKHLDDLFAAARHEEPILSQENARDLLKESNHMQLPSKLISTKGAIMTSIGFSIAAVTAYVVLGSSPANHSAANSPQTQISNLPVHSAVSYTGEPKKSNPAASGNQSLIAKDESGESVPTPPEPPQPPSFIPEPPVPPAPPAPPVRVMPPLKVTGITPTELSSDKYASMGISKKDDGTVSFFQKSESGNIFTMSFPKNSWGIIMNDDDDSTNMVPNPPSFAPLIVTDTKGNKRMMQFTGNSNGNKLRSLEIQSHSDGPGMQNALQIKKLVRIGGSDGDIDKLSIGLDSNDIKEMNEDINLQMKDMDEEGETSSSAAKQNQVHVFAKVNRHRSDSTVDGKKHGVITINKMICMDTSIQSLKSINMDSIMQEVRKSMKNVSFQLKNIDFDSVYKASVSELKKAEFELKRINMDSMMKEADKNLKKANDELKRMNLDSLLKSATESMIEAEDIMAKRCNELNSLVPILVRKSTKEHYDSKEDITYDDGLIFWYDNSEEFEKKAPEVATAHLLSVANSNHQGWISNKLSDADLDKIQAISNPDRDGKAADNSTDITTASAISKSLIYPNPARNTTTVRFDISEPRTIAFSIHDLLGKRVTEAGNLTASSAGSYEKELNVNELAAGVYLLVITTDKGEQSIQRLVVEK